MLAAAVFASTSFGALAEDTKAGQVMIEAPWARVTLQNRPAAAYMKIHNMGDAAAPMTSP